jgi:hypothetical protein
MSCVAYIRVWLTTQQPRVLWRHETVDTHCTLAYDVVAAIVACFCFLCENRLRLKEQIL